MSLSSYSSDAFDPDGKSASTTIPCGDFLVEVYKTWVYIFDKNRKYLMEFREGHLIIGDTVLYAAQGPEGVYLAVYCYESGFSLLALGVYTGDESIPEDCHRHLFGEFQTAARVKIQSLPHFKYPYGAM